MVVLIAVLVVAVVIIIALHAMILQHCYDEADDDHYYSYN